MSELRHFTDMTEINFIKAGVMGWPVEHSKSPVIHQYWMEKYELAGDYGLLPAAPAELDGTMQFLWDEGYAGFNVTVPHKEVVFEMVGSADKKARKIGAANTVWRDDNSGMWRATNTDGFGFTQNVYSAIDGFSFKEKTAVVLGAGGAARAILFALMEEGAAEIRLLNRTRDRADALAKHFDKEGKVIKVIDWDDRDDVLDDIHFLVNTTSLGMEGQPDLEIDLTPLPPYAIVNDIVYAPLKTPLLRQAEGLDLKIVTGIGMLLHQARPAFEKWFGILPDVDEALVQKVLAG